MLILFVSVRTSCDLLRSADIGAERKYGKQSLWCDKFWYQSTNRIIFVSFWWLFNPIFLDLRFPQNEWCHWHISSDLVFIYIYFLSCEFSFLKMPSSAVFNNFGESIYLPYSPFSQNTFMMFNNRSRMFIHVLF